MKGRKLQSKSCRRRPVPPRDSPRGFSSRYNSENASMTCDAIMSSKQTGPTCSFLLNTATIEVPATGKCGAQSEARQSPSCASTSSTQVSECVLLPSESTNTRFNRCAAIWPQFTCNYVAIFSGPVRLPSLASPRATALQDANVSGVSKRYRPPGM